jgi:hypothetical protein
MSYTGFGRSKSGVFQVAYVVENLDKAIRTWVEQQGVGPWFTMSNFTGSDATYRGEPSTASISLAMAFSGTTCFELIQPDDEQPSIWREHIERHGYGFHHFGKLSSDFDADIERYVNEGHELVYQAGVPTGGRIGFVDTTDTFPGYQELVEADDLTDAMFTQLYAAGLTWDGNDPVRPFG